MSSVRTLILLTVASICAGWALAGYYDRREYPIVSDSVKYIQSAQSLLDGKGLVHMPNRLERPFRQRWVPLQLWPPGYPVTIAAVSRVTGLDVPTTSVILARLSLWLIPAALLLALSPLGLGGWAILIAIMASSSVGLLDAGNAALSDAPYFLLAALSFAFLFRAVRLNSLQSAALSGLLAGVALTYRNVGLALCGAAIFGLTTLAFFSPTERRKAIRIAAVFAAVGIVPVAAMWIRNLLVFGMIQPYEMASSTVGMFSNVRWWAGAIITEITAQDWMGWAAWNRWPMLLCVAGIAVVLVAAIRKRSSSKPVPLHELFAWSVLLIYAALSSFLLIAGRTRYQWGDLINPRYVAQFVWVLLAAGVALGRFLGGTGRRSTTALTIVFALLLAGRVERLIRLPHQPSVKVAKDVQLPENIRRWVAQGSLVVSDQGPLLTALSNVGVRKISPFQSPSAFHQQLLETRDQASEEGLGFRAVFINKSLAGIFSDELGVDYETPDYVVMASK